MKYYIIAGEASGDMHAANLMKALSKGDNSAEFRCWGGDKMAAAGGTIVKHYKDLAFMGFVQVLRNLRTIFRNLDFCKQDILDYAPDVVILVDYPGFNLRIAKFLKQHQLKCFYYISPQIWAWNQSRAKQIKQNVDRMFVILPFEKDFYAKFDHEVDYVGHPLLDELEQIEETTFIREIHSLDERPIVALLPGSRKQEITVMLPEMLSVVSHFPSYQFVVAGAGSIDEQLYQDLIGQADVKFIKNQTYPILKEAKAALVTSGTATLETALFGVPQVVCYKGGWISYLVAKYLLIKVKFISLVNLVMDREVVTELIQGDLNTTRLTKELERILVPEEIERLQADHTELREKLGGPGASERTANLMLGYLKWRG